MSLGVQKKKQERAVMLLQRESKKCDELQAGLAQLKRQKVCCSMTQPRDHKTVTSAGIRAPVGKAWVGCCGVIAQRPLLA